MHSIITDAQQTFSSLASETWMLTSRLTSDVDFGDKSTVGKTDASEGLDRLFVF